VVTPAARRHAAQLAGEEYGLSERRASRLVGVPRSTVRYRARRTDPEALCTRLRALAAERPRAGYRTLWRCVRREGFAVNHKRVHRLYRREGLALRRRPRKKRTREAREPIAAPTRLNQRWSMDFMRDTLASGRAFRTFNVVDDLSRESRAIEIDHSLPGLRVVRTLDAIAAVHGYPEEIVCDNGPEFTGRALDQWALQRHVPQARQVLRKLLSGPIVQSSKASTAASATNVSTSIGFSTSPMRGASLARGARTTTRAGRIVRWVVAHRKNLPRSRWGARRRSRLALTIKSKNPRTRTRR
jgi:putative transposase